MRIFHVLTFIAITWVACDGTTRTTGQQEDPAPSAPTAPLPLDSVAHMLHGRLVPLEGSALRFDGLYKGEMGKVVQLIRFYPQGFAVLVNGPDSTPDKHILSAYIDPRAASMPERGFHNVPVVVRGDSVYMVAKLRHGTLDYRCRLHRPDSLAVFKHSHVTGSKALVGFTFLPDSSAQHNGGQGAKVP